MDNIQIRKLNAELALQGKTKKQFAAELGIARTTLDQLLSGVIKGIYEGSKTWKAKRIILELIAEDG